MYNILIVDDEVDVRKKTYDLMLSKSFGLDYEKDASTEKAFAKLDSPDFDCILLDMVVNEDPQNSDTFKTTLHYIGKKKPVILVSRFFNQIASWLNDIRTTEYNIIGYFGWEEFERNEEKNITNIISAKINFSLNDYFVRTQSKKLPNERITILHISDLQFGDPEFSNETLLSETIIADTIINQQNIRPDFIVITGDMAYSGKPSEFEHAFNWITELAKRIFPQSLESINERVLVVPGNHDVNLSISALDGYEYNFSTVQGDKGKRHPVTDDLLIKKEKAIRDHKTLGLLPFSEFAYKLTKNSQWLEKSNSLSWINDRFLNWGIRFIHLNSVSELDHNSPDKVEINSSALRDAGQACNKNNPKIFTIYLSHNGPDDMGYSLGEDGEVPCANLFSFLIQTNGNLFLHGHRHATTSAYKRDYKDEAIGSKLRYLLSGTLNLNRAKANDVRRSFSIIELERESGYINPRKVLHRIFEIPAKTPKQIRYYNIYNDEDVI